MYIETVNPMALATSKGVSIQDFVDFVQSQVKTKDSLEARFFALAIEYAMKHDCEIDLDPITNTVTFK